ncbi:flagellar protein FlaG [Desulfoplanes formicivorans]|uniref:Flagellar protein FlaG n=1 Tax=Desulfoplanes formicivorans TaxID=1592317 RepID=A0A194AFN5_9BACT|nr:flagellar protein FlaG [Desulfoplanes formicivorans]GAU08015.1 flagellar protein FlaG [Desulfoplanes formicivorans]
MRLEPLDPQESEFDGPEAVTPPAPTEYPAAPLQQEHAVDSGDAPHEGQSFPSRNVQETEIDKVSNALEQFWKAMGVSLIFKVDKETDIIQVEVIDPSTNKVIKKIPTDEILHMAASIRESVGIFVDKNT